MSVTSVTASEDTPSADKHRERGEGQAEREQPERGARGVVAGATGAPAQCERQPAVGRGVGERAHEQRDDVGADRPERSVEQREQRGEHDGAHDADRREAARPAVRAADRPVTVACGVLLERAVAECEATEHPPHAAEVVGGGAHDVDA